MNRRKALEILEVREDASDEELKREYRKKLLMYHPDKNKAPDASAKFIEVQEAYTYLQSNSLPSSSDFSYSDILKSFLSSVLPIDELIIGRISGLLCAVVENNLDAIIEYLRTINRDTLSRIYGVIYKYKHLIHFNSELFERIEELLREDECVYLNPRLDVLLSDENVYILKRDGSTYLVPLWHHEVVFDVSGKNLVVKNNPIMPDNMDLDEYNILTVKLQYKLAELWDREVQVEVGSKTFAINGNMLRLTGETQRIEFGGAGVPYNDSEDIFAATKRQSVVLMVNLLQ
jgi:hypothetical protein